MGFGVWLTFRPTSIRDLWKRLGTSVTRLTHTKLTRQHAPGPPASPFAFADRTRPC